MTAPPPLSKGLGQPLKKRLYIWVGSRGDVYVIDCNIEVLFAMHRSEQLLHCFCARFGD